MIKDLRSKLTNELVTLLDDLKFHLLKMRFQQALGETKGLHKLKEVRKTIAQVATVLTERNVKVAYTLNGIQVIKRNENNTQEITLVKTKHQSLTADQQIANQTHSSKKPHTTSETKKTTPKKTPEKTPLQTHKTHSPHAPNVANKESHLSDSYKAKKPNQPKKDKALLKTRPKRTAQG